MPPDAEVFTYAPIHKVDDVLFNVFHTKLTENVIKHRHQDCIEITLVESGTALHLADEKELPLHRGDICVTLPDGVHAIEKCEQLEVFTVSCNSDVKNVLGFNLNFLYGMRDLFGGRGKTVIFHLDSAEFSDVIQVVQQMDRMQYEPKKSELRSYFTVLLCLLTQGYARGLLTGKERLQLQKTRDYIHLHFGEELRLSKLAKYAALSESQLIRSFKREFKTTPINYQLELRMTEARRLLEGTSLGISEIADRLGFSDSNYFSHCFRKKIGQSPRQYRQQFLAG